MSSPDYVPVSNLQVANSAAGVDRVLLVLANGAVRIATLDGLLDSASVVAEGTPANSSVAVTEGQVMHDSNYLYVATANNTLKRVLLESF